MNMRNSLMTQHKRVASILAPIWQSLFSLLQCNPIAMATPTPPAPAPSLLEALPLHLFEEVCEHVVADGTIKHNLSALSKTCRRLHSATARIQYRHVRIEFRRHIDLCWSADRLFNTLKARNCMRYVQQLTVYENEFAQDGKETLWPPDSTKDEFFPRSSDAWPLSRGDEFWTRPDPAPFFAFAPVLTEVERALILPAWFIIGGALVPRLTGLKDFFYQCQEQIPSILFDHLNRHPNSVRLHMDTFSLRSLYQERDGLHDIEADEYLLASSLSLSSIRAQVPIGGIDHDGRVCFNEDAVGEMVQGLAPNLKTVSMDWAPMDSDTWEYYDSLQSPMPEWPGFFFEHPSGPDSGRSRQDRPRRKGALETLALGNGSGIRLGSEHVLKWSRWTDFNVLRSLHLRPETMELSALEALSGIAESGGFQSLRCLSLWIRVWEQEQDEFDFDLETRIDSELARLLRALPPLYSLELNGLYSQKTFATVLKSHGKSLRKLRLVPERESDKALSSLLLSRTRVQALVRACQNITDLELLTPRWGGEKEEASIYCALPRWGGDKEEASIYRALARLPRLDRLSLLLDCCTYVESEPEESDDEGHTPADKRDGVIKLTLDVMLAKDIFESLCRHRSPRLIRLRPVEIGNIDRAIPDPDLVTIGNCLSRVWVRHEDEREGKGHGYLAMVTRSREWKEGERKLRKRLDNDPHYCGLHDIWPAAKGDMKKMSSFRLWKEKGKGK